MRPQIISIRVSVIEKARLRKTAQHNGIPISDLVRRLLWKELAGVSFPEISHDRQESMGH